MGRSEESQYAAVQEVFLRALALHGEERQAFLDEACGSDLSMRSSLDDLLKEYEAGSNPSQASERVLGAPLPGDGKAMFVPGHVLADRYRVVSLLGRGGMGEVYRADDLKLEQAVALKFLPPALSKNQALLKALYNEVRLARRVSHRNVARMYDIVEIEGLHFLTMEYIEGEDLGALLRRIGRLPLDKVIQLARQLCQGLDAAHEEGLLHLDLKPANLMIDQRGDLKITDFGLARLCGENESVKQIGGTPGYMAPEHERGEEVTVRSDLYALGLILFEMATGERGKGNLDEKRLSRMDPDLAAIIRRCTAGDPDNRPGAAFEVLADLEAVRKESALNRSRVSVASEGRQTAVLFFSDIVDSVGLQRRIGSNAFAQQIERHDQLFHWVIGQSNGGQVLQHTGDGFMISFPTASEAVKAALRLQWSFHEEPWLAESMKLCIGLHLGEVIAMREKNTSEVRPVGMATNLAARIMGLAEPEQILMTRAVYDDARQFVREHPATGSTSGEELEVPQWLAHGRYELKGNEEAVEIFEVGTAGMAPLTAPHASEKASPVTSPHLVVVPEERAISADDVKESDVYISYASVDNAPLAEGKQGWVTQFHRNLEVRAQQLLGEKVIISRPPKAVGCEDVDEAILERLPDVKAMVSVVSPPFAHSVSCKREVAVFHEGAGDQFRIENKPRLLPAVKTPVDAQELSGLGPALEGLSGFEFYEKDAETGRVREFEEAFGEEARQRYYERVYDLAFDLCNVLKACRRVGVDGEQQPSVPSTGVTVYLAATTSDLEAQTDCLRRELLEQGHQVLPSAPLPFHQADLENAVREYLDQSDCVIQVVGPTYGMVPENARHSLLELQNEWCAQRVERRTIPRFIWMPRGMTVEDDRQEAFINRLREVDAAEASTEVLEGTLSALRDRVVQRLQPEPAASPMEGGNTSHGEGHAGPPLLYLICDQGDEEAVEALEDYLFEKGLQVNLPEFAAEQDEVSATHRDQLKECDAVMIYYGSARKAWVDIKLRDLIKANGYGRETPIDFQGVYIAPPEDRRKERFRAHGAKVFHQVADAFAPTAELDAFIESIMTKNQEEVSRG